MPWSKPNALWVVNWSTDCDAQCNYIDPQWRQITGQPVESAIGEGWLDSIREDDRTEAAAELNRAAEEKRPFQIIAWLRRMDGQFRRAMAVGAPRHDEKGVFTGFGGTIIDFPDQMAGADGRASGAAGVAVEMTEPKKNTEALQASESRCRSVFETSRDGIVIVDLNGRILDANPAYQKMLGYTLDELQGMTYQQLTPAIWRDMEAAIVREHTLLRGESPEYEKEYIRKDGTVFPINLRIWTITDEKGRITGMSAFVRDITERRRTEAALRQSQTKFQAAFTSLAEAVFIADADGRLTDFNDEFLRYHRYRDKDECSRGVADCAQLLDVWFPDGSPAPLEQWALPRALRGEAATNVEFRLARKDTGESWWGSYNFAPIRDESGKIVAAVVAARDISKSKEAHEGLRASERRFRAIFNHQFQYTGLLAPDGRVIEISQSVVRGTGVAPEEIIGKSFLDSPWWRDLPGARETWRRLFEDALKSSAPSQAETAYRTAEGALCHALNTVTALRDEQGEVEFLLVEGMDITERRQAEEKLRDNKVLLQAVIEGSADAIFLKDREGRLLLANPATFDAIGKPAAFCIGKTDAEFLLNPDDARAIMANDRRIMELGQSELFDEIVHTPMGVRCFRNSKAPYRDAAGKVIGLIGTARDITELRKTEAALRESEERFRVLTQAIPSITWESDADGVGTFMSKRWFSYTGMSAAELANDGWINALHPDDRETASRKWAEAVASRQPFDSRHRLRGADGSYRWFLARALPRFDAEGRVFNWVGSCTDIDEMVQAQALLAAADRRKDEFLATLAHELRNPLAPISNAVNVLKRRHTFENPDGALLDMAERQVDHLIRLVDELLEISRISRGKVELHKQSVAVSEFLRDALETCQPLIDKKGHRVTVRLADEPLWVFGDSVRLAQIAANIVNNAVKYTPPGGLIEIEAGREDGGVVLRVRDNGVGISAGMIPRVFDLFSQTEGQLGLSEGGLGIGLALVRKLVDLHGGRIAAHSAGEGRGSEFVVWLPPGPEPAVVTEPSEKAAAGEGKTARVLVIDDHKDGADSFGLLLETLGATVRKAYDGPAGVAAIEEFEPHLIFVDIGMPGVDGYETARRIRRAAQRRQFILVALTGWGQEHDRRRAREAGFDLHLTKPASSDAVEDLLHRVRAAGDGAIGDLVF